MKRILFMAFCVCFYTSSFTQDSASNILFIIDSIPLFNEPEDWNTVMASDIADMNTITNTDSLKLLGYENYDALRFIFTKEYRGRPDSIKRIPGLSKMQLINNAWHYNSLPYTGQYRDYYNNGKLLNEGTLQDGKLNGALKTYFPNGLLNSVINFKNNVRDGTETDYYPNGILRQITQFKGGKNTGLHETYFVNGQLELHFQMSRQNRFDTIFYYYSTGKLKQMKLIKNGIAADNKKQNKIELFTSRADEGFKDGDMNKSVRYALQIIEADSTNAAAYYKVGIAMYWQYLFDRAITEFDKALEIEPLMAEAYGYRSLCRVKKYQFLNARKLLKEDKLALLNSVDKVSIPADEIEKICSDLKQAQGYDYYSRKMIEAALSNYCKE